MGYDPWAVDWQGWIAVVGGVIGAAGGSYTAIRWRAIENYRAKLKSEGYEHEVRFARLQEKRVETIADLYTKLVETESAFAAWFSPMAPADEAVKEKNAQHAIQVGNEYIQAFRRSRIWLDDDLVGLLDDLNRKLLEANVDFTMYDPKDWTSQREYRDSWVKAWRTVENEVPEMRGRIERRFREMLGVLGEP